MNPEPGRLRDDAPAPPRPAGRRSRCTPSRTRAGGGFPVPPRTVAGTHAPRSHELRFERRNPAPFGFLVRNRVHRTPDAHARPTHTPAPSTIHHRDPTPADGPPDTPLSARTRACSRRRTPRKRGSSSRTGFGRASRPTRRRWPRVGLGRAAGDEPADVGVVLQRPGDGGVQRRRRVQPRSAPALVAAVGVDVEREAARHGPLPDVAERRRLTLPGSATALARPGSAGARTGARREACAAPPARFSNFVCTPMSATVGATTDVRGRRASRRRTTKVAGQVPTPAPGGARRAPASVES